jgi:cytoskeletal protein RodZ
VSIGGTLAEARHRAGLTVSEVSAHTRIREGLIRAIEQDEFQGCGGHFYARGHIRAIASVVGADPQALISEYEAEHPDGRPDTLEDLLSQPSPRQPREPREPTRGQGSWLGPVVLLVCIGLIVYAAYQLTPGSRSSGAAASPGRTAPRAAPSHSARPSARSASPSGLATPRPATRTIKPVSAVAFGPGGTSDGDNPQVAAQALAGDPATPWETSWYTTARFGNLQAGTGLLLDLGRTVTATRVTIRLGDTPGADLQVRAGTSASHLRVVASAYNAGGTVRLRLRSHPHAQYLLIWFTLLPPDAAGTYQAAISKVTVTAYAG